MSIVSLMALISCCCWAQLSLSFEHIEQKMATPQANNQENENSIDITTLIPIFKTIVLISDQIDLQEHLTDLCKRAQSSNEKISYNHLADCIEQACIALENNREKIGDTQYAHLSAELEDAVNGLSIDEHMRSRDTKKLKKLIVQCKLKVLGNATFAKDVTIDGTLTTGNVTVGNCASKTGDLTVGNNIDVCGCITSNANNNLCIDANEIVYGDLTITGSLTVASGGGGFVTSNATSCINPEGYNALARFDGASTTALTKSALRGDNVSGIQSTSPLLAQDCTITNLNLALIPKGTGALVASIPDGSSGGNGRGVKSVDLQMSRVGNVDVASGDYAVISGGQDNMATGTQSTVSGGWSNITYGDLSVIGGGKSNIAGLAAPYFHQAATVSGGEANFASGDYSTIGGGKSNSAGDAYATVGGGESNNAHVHHATIGGGKSNNAGHFYATVGGGISNSAVDPYATIGGGISNTAAQTGVTIGGGESNSASGADATIGGGHNNQATGDFSTVAGGGSSTPALGNWSSGSRAAIGGGQGNLASGDSAVISGGDSNNALNDYSVIAGGQNNRTTAHHSTIGGGSGNIAQGVNSTVAGGASNNISGVGESAVISGGLSNSVTATVSVVSGGSSNTIHAHHAAIGGGELNISFGHWSTIPGGINNRADGDQSFAAGSNAEARHQGAFVWADSTGGTLTSDNADQLKVRASGGTIIYSDAILSAGVTLAAGASAWAAVSDRNRKENFVEVDGVDILNKLMTIPIESWNYKAQDASIHHIGPMAQDFNPTFGFTETPLAISTLDMNGVALAAIQGLYKKVSEYGERINQLEEIIRDLRANMTATN
ncbi:MAG: tail fiber domain-containing protein [Candidatus Dependentiae bacterium]|nr:tail fiber domain-containing protein [Candidatus Dependentiae bacterium]